MKHLKYFEDNEQKYALVIYSNDILSEIYVETLYYGSNFEDVNKIGNKIVLSYTESTAKLLVEFYSKTYPKDKTVKMMPIEDLEIIIQANKYNL